MNELTYAERVFDSIIRISKVDPEAATQLLHVEANRNKYLSKFKSIRFNAPTTESNWVTITGCDGQIYQVYLPGIERMADIPVSPTDDDMRRIIIPVADKVIDEGHCRKNDLESLQAIIRFLMCKRVSDSLEVYLRQRDYSQAGAQKIYELSCKLRKAKEALNYSKAMYISYEIKAIPCRLKPEGGRLMGIAI